MDRLDYTLTNKSSKLSPRYSKICNGLILEQKRIYSTKASSESNLNTLSNSNLDSNLNPWWVTGFCDAESCFQFGFKILKVNLDNIQPFFQIGLHIKDLEVLKIIKKFFGDVGSITYENDSVKYRVSSLNDILTKIIPHFDKYPLITQKLGDYIFI
jgi:hypothetical protein